MRRIVYSILSGIKNYAVPVFGLAVAMIEPLGMKAMVTAWIGRLNFSLTGIVIAVVAFLLIMALKWASSMRIKAFDDSVMFRQHNFSVSVKLDCVTGIDRLPVVERVQKWDGGRRQWGPDLLSNIHMQLPRNSNLADRWQPTGASCQIVNLGHIEPPDGGPRWRFFFDFNNPPPEIRSAVGDPDRPQDPGLETGVYRLQLADPKNGELQHLEMRWTGLQGGIELGKKIRLR